nr:multiple coagulation factor deficiency protein 2 homolog [Ciona intestinalis]|eukprot:XP_009858836.1 multiple coagulation factor deficiency protein 2 homolog [Ciona intestinalis]
MSSGSCLMQYVSLFAMFIAVSVCQEPLSVEMDASTEYNKAHLKEDLEGVIDKSPEDMSINELQFHYFRQHDYDKDEKLDGNEIVASILHHTEHAENPDGVTEGGRKFSDDQLVTIIDDVLKYQDRNNDGKLDFQEYITPYQDANPDA